MRLFLGLAVVTTLGCVPLAKPSAGAESSINAPPAPDSRKSATSLLNSTPAIIAPADPPEPTASERRVAGAWRWTGTEYRWIPAHNEPNPPSYVWKRD